MRYRLFRRYALVSSKYGALAENAAVFFVRETLLVSVKYRVLRPERIVALIDTKRVPFFLLKRPPDCFALPFRKDRWRSAGNPDAPVPCGLVMRRLGGNVDAYISDPVRNLAMRRAKIRGACFARVRNVARPIAFLT